MKISLGVLALKGQEVLGAFKENNARTFARCRRGRSYASRSSANNTEATSSSQFSSFEKGMNQSERSALLDINCLRLVVAAKYIEPVPTVWSHTYENSCWIE